MMMYIAILPLVGYLFSGKKARWNWQ